MRANCSSVPSSTSPWPCNCCFRLAISRRNYPSLFMSSLTESIRSDCASWFTFGLF